MLTQAEYGLVGVIGTFCTVPPLLQTQNYMSGFPSSQCLAFLLSSREFTWFIESWEVSIDDTDGKGRLKNKKLYPAKVTGLNLPSFFAGTLRWKEELVSYSYSSVSNNFAKSFQPGFGQQIVADTNRSMKTAVITQTAPTLSGGVFSQGQISNLFNDGAAGRLMSIASYIDPELAAKYNTETDAELKNKSLNSINYQQYPVTYPAYSTYP